MNLAQTTNRLTKAALAELTPDRPSLPSIKKMPEYDVFFRISNALTAITAAAAKGDYQTAINRPFADKTDEVVRGLLEGAGFKLDIDSRPSIIFISWK